MNGRFLMVIPPVVVTNGGPFEVDVDFANNLRAYLEHFEHVTLACPLCPPENRGGIPSTVPLTDVVGHERVTVAELPLPYREDRYLRARSSVARTLRHLIEQSDYLSFSPHGPLDWATLAAKIAISMGRSYDIGADWDVEKVAGALIAEMPAGPQKVRRSLLLKDYLRDYRAALRGSSLALLMGEDVFEAYRNVTPNPHKVFNVQVTAADRLNEAELAEKLRRITAGEPLIISYAGRAHEMKGPFDWLNAVHTAAEAGVRLHATWFGDGPLLQALREKQGELGLADSLVAFPGKVDRATVMETVRRSDIYLVCHKTPESPRNLIEALACAAPLLSYEGRYARDLVSRHGGGEFVPLHDWKALAQRLRELDADRPRLAQLVRDANATAQTLDREQAIKHRIDLIKKYVRPPKALA